ncbi:MAG: Crp/Fnr family transcriptional regulator [Saprospiraceae bacterium]
MFQQFFQFTDNYLRFSEKEKSALEDILIFREVPKKYPLLKIGEIAREVYFINKGCARLFYDKDGEEITGFFFLENMMLGGFESMLTRQPSQQGIETLEPCELVILPFLQFEDLHEKIPRLNIFTRKFLAERFVFAQKVVASLILDSPEERYLRLFQRQPELLNRVPQHMLATYLGITPVSLSRIRKRIFDGK